MSNSLTVAEISSFDKEVKHAYQGMGKLRNTVRVKTGVVGSTHRFPKLGKGLAAQRVYQSEVEPMNLVHTNVTATLNPWIAPEYTDIFQEARTNVDERRELAQSIAGAISRREDQIILDALAAASSPNTVGDTSTALGTATFRSCRRTLSALGVPDADRTMIITAKGEENLLGDSLAQTFDSNAIKVLVEGQIYRWLGFTIIVLEDRTEGGITITSPGANQDATHYAYHKAAVGLAINQDFRSEVNYVPSRTSWLACGMYQAGAVGIDTDGIVEITTNEP